MPADAELKPCPFCGQKPDIEPWHGGSKTKVMISCVNELCKVMPCCTGNTEGAATVKWNHRAPLRHDRVLVPMEPTEEMLNAAWKAGGRMNFANSYIEIYKAMLSAAPREIKP